MYKKLTSKINFSTVILKVKAIPMLKMFTYIILTANFVVFV